MAKSIFDFLVERTPDFDEMILKDIRETDCWILKTVPGGDWWSTREEVRRISEGLAYKPSPSLWEESRGRVFK